MTSISLTIAILACISASWNAAQASITETRHRLLHFAIVALVILSLLAMALIWPPVVTRAIGFSLLAAATILGVQVSGLRRFLCALQAIFGLIAATGLPFAAA